jgi:hypothetical protein
MPLPPKPFTLTCPHCGWSKIFHPHSDAYVIGRDWLSHCPICNCDTLEMQPATPIEQFVGCFFKH